MNFPRSLALCVLLLGLGLLIVPRRYQVLLSFPTPSSQSSHPIFVKSSSPLVDLANRGVFPLNVSQDKVSVVLWGDAWYAETNLLEQAGCPFSRTGAGAFGCPLYPRCSWRWSINSIHAFQADVLIVLVTDQSQLTNELLHRLPKHRPLRVLYQREALWSVPRNMPNRFHLDMSFRADAGVTNPNFLRTPDSLFENDTRNLSRPLFAMSLISDCHTRSHREKYVLLLLQYLGKNRLHRYGECGDGTHVMPRGSFSMIKQYKFFLAFENAVVEGYTTEKLYRTLELGPVPVYLGAPDVMNVTKTPSFINVRDFAGPRALANYLIYLADHPDEYNKYHAWRSGPDQLTDEYLRTVADHLPGPLEQRANREHLPRGQSVLKRSLCCRLCNLDFVEQRVNERNLTDQKMLNAKMWGWLNSEIFGGALNGGGD